MISRVSPNVRWLDTIGGIYYTVNGEEDFVFNVNVTGKSLLRLVVAVKTGLLQPISNKDIPNSYNMNSKYH